MDNAHRIKWTLLATLGWSAAACGGALDGGGNGGTGGSPETSGDGESNTGELTSGDGDGSGGGDGDGSGGDNGDGDGDGSGGTTGTGGATTGGTSAGGAGAGGSGGTSSKVSCTSPREENGFVYCEEGYSHRTQQRDCPNELDKDGGPAHVDEGFDNECTVHSDCDGELSYCQAGQFGDPTTSCVTGCLTDDDCGAGYVCQCGSPVGSCRKASCTTDGDCAPDHLCASDHDTGCGAAPRFACTADDDMCRSASDCSGGQGCSLSDEERSCVPMVVCGRPFLVGGEDRKATLVVGDAFSTESLRIKIVDLTREQAHQIHEHYLRAARMEHASIAAFARFTLQLLQLGAPAELIEQAGKAQLDETRHAKVCFALANAYEDNHLTPGPLDLSGALEDMSFKEIVRLCVLEGCIGESTAAHEAAEAAAQAEDEQLARLLARIADDELDHAALSFRFVKWALNRDPSLRPYVKALFDEQLNTRNEKLTSSTKNEQLSLNRHGVLSPEQQRSIRQQALSVIVAPCAEALFQSESAELSALKGPQQGHPSRL